jgi:hypothetical protein
MFDFEECEEVAGHRLTLLNGMISGVSTYYCELILFHGPLNSETSVAVCRVLAGPRRLGTTLKDKLKASEIEMSTGKSREGG